MRWEYIVIAVCIVPAGWTFWYVGRAAVNSYCAARAPNTPPPLETEEDRETVRRVEEFVHKSKE